MGEEFNHKIINNTIHSRIRLAVISYLYRVNSAEFNEIKEKVNTTDGNLSIHLGKLEEEGYLDVKKYFKGKIPATSYTLTDYGKREFEEYVRVLEEFINDTKN